MLVSCVGYVGSGMLHAVMPPAVNYRAFVFPAIICSTISIDISFNLTNIFIITNTPKMRQVSAGTMINCSLHMCIAVMLAVAEIIQTRTLNQYHLGLR